MPYAFQNDNRKIIIGVETHETVEELSRMLQTYQLGLEKIKPFIN